MVKKLATTITVLSAGLLFSTGVLAGEKKYSEGASDTEIKLGQTMPYSGPLSVHGIQGRTEVAYFRMLNEEKGGINGRKINLISLDDAFSPPKTVEQTRKLVEDEGVIALFGSSGTAAQSAVQKYLNTKAVPQLLVSTGANKWNQPKAFPWSTPAFHLYGTEGEVLAKYLLSVKPDAKVAILRQNDDFGRDYVAGFKKGLGDKAATMIVKEVSYELSDPTLDSQVAQLKSSGADTFFNVSLGKAASQSFKKAYELQWKPLQLVVSPSIGRQFLEAAGLESVTGIIAATPYKQVSSPRWGQRSRRRRVPGVHEEISSRRRSQERDRLCRLLLRLRHGKDHRSLWRQSHARKPVVSGDAPEQRGGAFAAARHDLHDEPGQLRAVQAARGAEVRRAGLGAGDGGDGGLIRPNSACGEDSPPQAVPTFAGCHDVGSR
jgi:ABC-type branched-subunit amino acid transport system substrate-binding protein